MERPPDTPRPDPTIEGTRILVLEDDAALRRSYVRRLRREGHVVDEAGTLAETRAALDSSPYHCLVLDRLVPDGDALDLVIERRQRPDHPPVLVISALGTPDQRVAGLIQGSDDYVSKPVPLRELAIRVRNLVINAGPADRAPIRLGGVVVDRQRGTVTVDGKELRLPPLQYRVLDCMVAHRMRMVTIEELLEHCWDAARSMFGEPLHTQVTRLRDALDDWLRIESVRGAGYVLRVVDPEIRAAGSRRGATPTATEEDSG